MPSHTNSKLLFTHLLLLFLAGIAILIGGLQWGYISLKHGDRFEAEEGRKTAFLIPLTIADGSLRDWDEAWYAQIAKETRNSDNYWFLRYQDERWFDKPPLSFWMTLFFYDCFGVNEFSARLFSACCGVLTILVTALIGSHLFGNRYGPMAGWILITSAHFLQFCRRGQTDIPITFFITLTLYFFLLGIEHHFFFWLAGLAFGAAIMTKGSIALFAAFIAFVYLCATKQFKVLKKISFWGGITLGIALALPWHLYQYQHHPQAFLQAYFGDHFGRVFQSPTNVSEAPFYYYFKVLTEDYRPWFLCFFLCLFLSFKEIFGRMVKKETWFPSTGEAFGFCWSMVVLLLLSLATTRLGWYLLPVYPGIALFLTYWFTRLAPLKFDFTLKKKKLFFNGEKFAWFAFLVLFLLFPSLTRKVRHIQHNPEIKALQSAIIKFIPNPKERILLYTGGDPEKDKHKSIFMPSTLFYGDRFVEFVREDHQKLKEILSKNPKRICLLNYLGLKDLQSRKEFSLEIVAQEKHLFLIRWKETND